MEKYLKKYYQLFFAAAAVLLLYPTLQKGYIFLLDWNVNPNISWADISWQTDSVGWIIYKLIGAVFSFGAAQRIALFAAVYFLGLAGFRLAKRTGNVFAQYFTGLFLIFNPFIYARLVEQPGVAFSNLFFFWFLIYFLEYLEGRSAKKIISTSILAGLAVSFSPHSVFFVGLASAGILFFEYLKNKDWKFFLKTIGLIFFAIILINANWLIAFWAGGKSGMDVAGFNSADWEAFDTRAIDGDSVYTTVLALQGYWGEYQDRFVSIRENPLWEIAFWLIFALAIFGLAKRWKQDYVARASAIIFAVGYVLAIGVASPITKPLSVFLYENIPFYIGLREPQKWVVILVFVYAYFGGWGIKHLFEIKKLKDYKKEIGIFSAILPVIFSFSAIRGMHEHFLPRAFPEEWQEAKNYLDDNQSKAREKILVFPWHLYMRLYFAGKNISLPAKNYFGKNNVIQGNNTEFGKVYTHSVDKQTEIIERYVIRKNNSEKEIKYENFAGDMEGLSIGKVILLKAEDWQKYDWLDRIGLEKVLDNDKLIIYNL